MDIAPLSSTTANGTAAAGEKVLQLKTAVCYLPHPDKVIALIWVLHLICALSKATSTIQVHYGGEDAFFVSSVGGGALGVADGVGGWQESGVNPAGKLAFQVHCCDNVPPPCPALGILTPRPPRLLTATSHATLILQITLGR